MVTVLFSTKSYKNCKNRRFKQSLQHIFFIRLYFEVCTEYIRCNFVSISLVRYYKVPTINFPIVNMCFFYFLLLNTLLNVYFKCFKCLSAATEAFVYKHITHPPLFLLPSLFHTHFPHYAFIVLHKRMPF